MKTLSLLVALLILAFSGLILASSYLSISFNWQDGLFYLASAAIVYGLIFLVGRSLNKKFNHSVEKFISGEKEHLLDDKGSIRTFGFLIITLLPYLLFLFGFALYAAISFSLYGLLLVSQAERVPVAFLAGLAIVALGTLFAILGGIYYLFFPPQRRPFGFEINNNEHPQLWALTKDLANRIKSKPVDRIIICPEAGIGVYLSGNILQTITGGGTKTLEIGIPSIQRLNISEFEAIITHEYGHFANRDTQWTSFTYALGSALSSAFKAMPGPGKAGGIAGGVIALNPAYHILRIYMNLYLMVTQGFSRIREILADVYAMKIYGGKTFSKALLQVALNDFVFGEYLVGQAIPELLEKEQVITNYSDYMNYLYEGIGEKNREELKTNILNNSAATDVYDSHPALNTRIEYSKRYEGEAKDNKKPIQTLFDDWEGLNQRLAEAFNNRYTQYTSYLNQLQTMAETQEVMDRYVGKDKIRCPNSKCNVVNELKEGQTDCHNCGAALFSPY